jgi:hypothetical protein
MELMLALGLIVLLASAAMVATTAWREGTKFDEGVIRFETMLRMARADAQNTGRRIRLSFDAETGQARVLWECDPIAQPNQFVEYVGCSWSGETPTGLVRVTRCELTGPSAYRTLVMDSAKTDQSSNTILEEVTFYPDGSSDSALIELAAIDEDSDTRRAVVELDGVNGTVATKIVSPLELQEQQAAGQ